MANKDTPFGFKPVGHLLGGPWNGKARVYYVPVGNAAILGIGDAVKSTGSSDASGKYAGVVRAAAGDVIRGIVIGIGDNPNVMVRPDTTNRHLPISTEAYVMVVDDPFVIFEIQEDNAANDMDADMVGLQTDIATVADASTTTGRSTTELDSSDTATALGQCKILGVSNREDNDLGTYCKWDVLIVEHEMNLQYTTDI